MQLTKTDKNSNRFVKKAKKSFINKIHLKKTCLQSRTLTLDIEVRLRYCAIILGIVLKFAGCTMSS